MATRDLAQTIAVGQDLDDGGAGRLPISVSRRWHIAAILFFAIAATGHMRAWFVDDLLPPYDFAGYASAVEEVRDVVLAHRSIPSWSSKWFAGTTRFTSSLKELATLPLAVAIGPVAATKLMFLLLAVLSGLVMYWVFATAFHAPFAGVLAGYAYALGMPASYVAASGHLDVPVSSCLLPLALVATLRVLQEGGWRWATRLGAILACQLANNHLQVGVSAIMVALLAVLRPWRGDDASGQTDRWEGTWRLAAAAVVFLALGLSQLAWLGTDARHHALHSDEHVEWGTRVFIEHSPFLYLNRNNWLGSWLAEHHPPEMPLFPDDPLRNQRHYLGAVAIGLCVAGAVWAWRQRSLRRWYQLFGLLFVLQCWLAMGPRTLLWQLARTFHAPESVDATLRATLAVGAAGCLAWAVFVAIERRRRGDPADVLLRRIEIAAAILFLLVFATTSLFEIARRIVPPLAHVRAPGQFFDLAPFSFYALLGVSLVAAERRFAPGRWARASVAASLLALIALDLWPARAAFARGAPLAPVVEARRAVAAVPDEGGTLRMGVSPWTSTESWRVTSLVISGARVGGAWSWLDWQAGPHWDAFWKVAMLWTVEGLDPGHRQRWRDVGETLAHVGRIKYLLDEMDGDADLDLPEPWRIAALSLPFVLWEQPSVSPMARGYGSWVVSIGSHGMLEAVATARSIERNAVLVAGGERLADVPAELLDGATAVVSVGGEPLADEESRRLAAARPLLVLVMDAEDGLLGETASFAAVASGRQPTALTYLRPDPERIVVEVGPGGQEQPRFVTVSEAFHPWWRGAVDGRPAPVRRAHLTFMGIAVPPGARRMELRFEPPLLVRAADAVSRFSWLAVAAGALVMAMPRYRARLAKARAAGQKTREPSEPEAPADRRIA